MNKFTRYIVVAAVTAGVLFLLWYFQNIVGYVLSAVVLSFLGKPIMHGLSKIRLKNNHLPRALCAAIAVAAIWGVFILFFYFFIPLIIGQLDEMGNIGTDRIAAVFNEPLAKLDAFARKNITSDPNFSLSASFHQELEKVFNVSHITEIFGSLASIVKSLAVALFAVTFITFFFLKEDGLFFSFVVLLVPQRYEENITRALKSVNQLLVRYFVGIFSDMLCILTILTLGLSLIVGLPIKLAMLIGLIAGVLNVVPYVGPLVACCLGLLMGLMSSMGAGAEFAPLAIKMLCVFLATQVIDAAFLQPYIYSNSIKAHPLEIFLVILTAGSVAGIIGMLVAIPTYTILRVFAKEFLNNLRVVQKLTERM
ncbi:MAG: AI-2E family transporter [Prevotellaceae bacterium]|jgi:predicted PurR-regulated permease PerM|nr:AI-2E family transporter [Prevotellaceae bacterium]